MKKYQGKIYIILIIAGTLLTCVDPYNPKLDKFQSHLVVDALLTDENISNYVSLSRSGEVAGDKQEMVSGAAVIIKDDVGNITSLSETSEGIYKTDSLSFRGEKGRSYSLNIKTQEGEEYESEQCLLSPLQDIDSIYFKKGEEMIDNENHEGIRIYVDSKGKSDCRYYRWKFEEWWKIRVPYPKRFDYINDSTFIKSRQTNEVCWSHNKSHEIVIKSTDAGISAPILFLASQKSDRLSIQYYIEIKQLSLSKKEFEFWNRMYQIIESGGDIFDKQPFQILGNIHNVKNQDEQVLGYFQVSGVKVKRRYITKTELSDLDLPVYQYECRRVEIGPMNYYVPGASGPIPTVGQIYSWFTGANYTFIEPVFVSGDNLRLVFVAPVCADCTKSGSITKPDFWIDSN